jgi:hypothetical protein
LTGEGEVLVVGSAARDVVQDDPRGWRLGGGVTYGGLTLARLGLRPRVLVGVDRLAADAEELDALREAGADVRLVHLDRSPVFENVETPAGRIQTCIEPGDPLSVRRSRPSGDPPTAGYWGRWRTSYPRPGRPFHPQARWLHSAGRGSCGSCRGAAWS